MPHSDNATYHWTQGMETAIAILRFGRAKTYRTYISSWQTIAVKQERFPYIAHYEIMSVSH